MDCPVCGDCSKPFLLRKMSETNIVKCNNCGFVWCDPFLDIASESSEIGFNLTTDEYQNDSISDISLMSRPASRICIERQQFYCRILGVGSNLPLRILEVGCSTGLLLNEFSKLGHNVKGYDLDHRCISAGRALWPELNIECSNIMSVNPTPSYDVIYLSQVLEHVQQPVDFLRHLRKFANPSRCVLHIDVPNDQSLANRLSRLVIRGNRYVAISLPHHQLAYSTASLNSLLVRSGWKNCQCSVFCASANHRVFGQLNAFKAGFIAKFYYFLSRLLRSQSLLVAVVS